MPGARGAAARRPAAGDAVVQGRPGAQQRHRADARDRRAGAGEARGPARHRRPRRGDDHRRLRRPPRRVRARKCTRCVRIRARSQVAANLRQLLAGSTLADIPYHLVPRFRPWQPASWDDAEAQALRFDIGWDWVPLSPAPRPREVLPALPAVPRRQEAPAAGQLFAALHPAGAWRGARCGRAGRSACSTSSSTRSPTTRWCSRMRRPSTSSSR